MATNNDQVLAQAAIPSEHRRRLSPVAYVSNAVKVLDIPRDTVIKRIEIRMVGTFQVTYASGSPIASPSGVASRICPRLDVIANGSRVLKSVDAHILGKQMLMLNAIQPERAYSVTASNVAPTSALGQTEKTYGEPFVYPATTYWVVVNESFCIYFEFPWAKDGGTGSDATLFNTKGLSSAELRFNFGDIANVQRDESSAVAITYSSVDVQFLCTLVEVPSIGREAKFMDYKETIRRIQYSAEVRDSLVDLPRGNLLTHLIFQVKNGDANKSLSDIALKDITLMLNGSKIIQRSTFLELQNSWRSRLGTNAPKGAASGLVTHGLQGICMMNLLIGGDIRTALDTSFQSGVDQVAVALTTAAASGVDAATYTNPVEITIHSGELARV